MSYPGSATNIMGDFLEQCSKAYQVKFVHNIGRNRVHSCSFKLSKMHAMAVELSNLVSI